MPLLRIETSAPLTDAQARKIAVQGSQLVAQALQKPEQYVMASVARAAAMSMAGTQGEPCAFCAVRSIGGLTDARCRELSASLCGLVAAELGVEPARIYVNFSEVDAARWGWNASTFG